MAQPISYRTVKIDGLSIFYREAGPKDAPTLLLLHGLPTSSRSSSRSSRRLADRFHLIAPDYPGFGHSDWPDPEDVRLHVRSHRRDHESFHGSARAVALHALHAGLRWAGWFPNGAGASGPCRSAHCAGRGRRTTKDWARTGRRGASFGQIARRTKGAARKSAFAARQRRRAMSGTIRTSDRYDPGSLDGRVSIFSISPARREIQSDLFYDYRTNVDAYPKWQAWMRENQPRLLVIWGRHDLSVRSRRTGTLSQGRAEGRSPRARRRPFRARYQGRRNRGAGQGLPEIEPPQTFRRNPRRGFTRITGANNENTDGPDFPRSTGQHRSQDWLLAGRIRRTLFVFRDAGVQLTLASPKGGQPPIDPKSDEPENQTDAMTRFKKDPAAQQALSQTDQAGRREIGGLRHDLLCRRTRPDVGPGR